MPLQVRSQLPYAEKGGVIDDCGPASLAIAIDYVNKYTTTTTVERAIEAAKKAGRVDVKGEGNGTTFAQLKKAGLVLDRTLRYTSPSTWTAVAKACAKGAALIVCSNPPYAIPKRVWSGWALARAKRGDNSSYGHYFVFAYEEGTWLYADPTQKDGQVGKRITEDEARTIAHWGSGGATKSRQLDAPYALLVHR